MKTAAFIAVSAFALARLVGAAPVNNRRPAHFFTTTEQVWETLWTTTTLWVDPSATAAVPTTTPAGDFFELHGPSTNTDAPTTLSTSSITVSKSQVAAVVASSSTSVSVAPAPTSTSTSVAPVPTSTSTSVAPAPTSTYVAPAPTSTYVAPASTSTYVAPAPTTSVEAAAAVATTSSTAAPAASSTSSGSSSGTGANTGDLTYYDVSVGTGSCGTTGSNADDLVAMNYIDMANGANPNLNPHCGKKINIYYNGATHSGTVMDTCPACAKGSIDVTEVLFNKVAPSGDGRVHGVTWSWA